MKRIRLCAHCGVLKRCSVRTRGRWICHRCYEHEHYPKRPCPGCGRADRLKRRVDGAYVCGACWNKQRSGICRECGRFTLLRGGRCARDRERTRIAELPRRVCPGCGHVRPLAGSRCARCLRRASAQRRLERMLVAAWGVDGTIRHPQLQSLAAYLLHERYPEPVFRWLRRLAPAGHAFLAAVREGGVITDMALERLRSLAGVGTLRLACQRAGLLPLAATARAERLVVQKAHELPRPSALLLRQYWRFSVAPGIRLRLDPSRAVDYSLASDLQSLRAVAHFLTALARTDTGVRDLGQDVIDAYLVGKGDQTRNALARFCRWLGGRGEVRRPLAVARPYRRAGRHSSRDVFFATLHAARTDARLPLDVRVALIFTLLSAQTLRTCAGLPRRAVQPQGTRLAVRFAPSVVWLFEGVEAELIARLAARSRRWLFPSPRCDGRALIASTLGTRIHRAGIRPSAADLRQAAVRELLREVDPLEVACATGHSASWASRQRGQREGVDAHTKERVAQLRWSPVA